MKRRWWIVAAALPALLVFTTRGSVRRTDPPGAPPTVQPAPPDPVVLASFEERDALPPEAFVDGLFATEDPDQWRRFLDPLSQISRVCERIPPGSLFPPRR